MSNSYPSTVEALSPQIERVKHALQEGTARPSQLAQSFFEEGIATIKIIIIFKEATGIHIADLKRFAQWWSNGVTAEDADAFDEQAEKALTNAGFNYLPWKQPTEPPAYTCPHCIGAFKPVEFDTSLIPQLLQAVEDRDMTIVFDTHRFKDIHQAKFIYNHIPIWGGYCVRCNRKLPSRGVSYCKHCGALNLDWSPQPVAPPFRCKKLVRIKECPKCGHSMGPGTTKCWAKGCDFQLPDNSYVAP